MAFWFQRLANYPELLFMNARLVELWIVLVKLLVKIFSQKLFWANSQNLLYALHYLYSLFSYDLVVSEFL